MYKNVDYYIKKSTDIEIVVTWMRTNDLRNIIN